MSKRLSITKTCPACKQDFHPFCKEQVCCSRLCTGRTSLILICEVCGKEYRKGSAMASRVKHRNTCSFACKFVGKSFELTCEYCGKSFKRIRAQVWADKKNFCSLLCAHAAMEVEKIATSCSFCGTTVFRYPSDMQKMIDRGYRDVFCSHTCRAAMIAAQFDPPRPYLGRHTSAPRNGHQTQQWRKAVLERDAHTCQDCGKTDILLNAHHIKPFALFEALRYDVSNGVTLCYQCHERRHSH